MADDRTPVGEKRDIGPQIASHRIVEEGRRYWSDRPTSGGKVAGIPFGAPGSWQECVDRVEPHLGEGAKGYCNLRYHEASGRWPGSGRHGGGK